MYLSPTVDLRAAESKYKQNTPAANGTMVISGRVDKVEERGTNLVPRKAPIKSRAGLGPSERTSLGKTKKETTHRIAVTGAVTRKTAMANVSTKQYSFTNESGRRSNTHCSATPDWLSGCLRVGHALRASVTLNRLVLSRIQTSQD
jgi:hypothetical protein